MNREDVIRMAREAGFDIDEEGKLYFGQGVNNEILLKANYNATVIDGIKALAQIAYDAGAFAEREACANVCDGYSDKRDANMADLCAEAIRARGQSPLVTPRGSMGEEV